MGTWKNSTRNEGEASSSCAAVFSGYHRRNAEEVDAQKFDIVADCRFGFAGFVDECRQRGRPHDTENPATTHPPPKKKKPRQGWNKVHTKHP